MLQGMLVFAQVMANFSLSTLRRCVATHRGDHKVQDFSCLYQFFAMSFAQLTARESLRDIEVNLRAQSARLYRMGFRCNTISRTTLANANALRLAQRRSGGMPHLKGKRGRRYQCCVCLAPPGKNALVRAMYSR